jgi:predicted thioesterase
MLRAHMPAKFKTPGSHAAVKANAPGASGLVVTPEVQAELMAMRQETLRILAEKKAKAIEVSGSPSS